VDREGRKAEGPRGQREEEEEGEVEEAKGEKRRSLSREGPNLPSRPRLSLAILLPVFPHSVPPSLPPSLPSFPTRQDVLLPPRPLPPVPAFIPSHRALHPPLPPPHPARQAHPRARPSAAPAPPPRARRGPGGQSQDTGRLADAADQGVGQE
jgi:hypothetical protein